MDPSRKLPLNKRLLTTLNVFILVCRGWLKDMKEWKPQKTWDELKFSHYKMDHSLTRRLAIAFHEKECDNDDLFNNLPDRFRQYWKTRRFTSYKKVFDDAEPVLFLPAGYKFPIFSLNDSLPTMETAYPNVNSLNSNNMTTNVESVNANCNENVASTSTAYINHKSDKDLPNSINQNDYKLCLNTMLDYLKYGSVATKNNSLIRIALILNKSGFNDEMQCTQFDNLVDMHCTKVKQNESLWKSIKDAINLKVNKNEVTYESAPLLYKDQSSSRELNPSVVSDENS